ncbi:MAG: EVE domain-containing protein [Neisseriaceae bacterium]|nr:MAG: EVE domain-containing protein [Neisseriaceae bacterium]
MCRICDSPSKYYKKHQAHNFMRDDMQIGDKVIFWHSSCK